MAGTVGFDPPSNEDLARAQRAIGLGWLSEEQLQLCLLDRERDPSSGLLQLMEARGYLTPAQVTDLQSSTWVAEPAAVEAALPETVRAAQADPQNLVASGRYVVVATLGEGPDGRVVKAWEIALARWVTLRMLHAGLDESQRERLAREAQVLAALRHPNIAAVYEFGRHGDVAYVAAQYIDGPAVSEMGVLASTRAVAIAQQIAQAIDFAHRHGVLHRNLHPGCIRVDSAGRAYVASFAMARAERMVDAETTEGTVDLNAPLAMGTPAYMAPEQVSGDVGRMDARSDIYSIGAVLYVMLTGRAPFSSGGGLDMIRQVLTAEAPPVRTLAPSVPRPLEAIVQRCLEKDRERRYASARELADALQQLGGASPAPASRPAAAGPSPDELAEIQRAMKDPSNRMGRYVLVKALGVGGQGVVYKGWDTELRRRVALKFLKIPGNESAARSIRQEAQVAAGMEHPNIATLYEVGVREDGSPFIAMQLVDGASLKDASRTLPRDELVRLVIDAADAVQYAHGRGIFHRDLKPQNVMVDREGRAYVMDFGLAQQQKAEGEAAGLSVTGVVVGTPQYMPPEQARGDLAKIDARSDVYGLGATLYELLTGRPPFYGVSVARILVQVILQAPDRPRQVKPDVPPDLEAVVLKCLEKDPARRYATATALADDLRRCLRGERVRARRPAVGRRALAAVLIVGACAAVATAGAWVSGLVRENRELRREVERLRARP